MTLTVLSGCSGSEELPAPDGSAPAIDSPIAYSVGLATRAAKVYADKSEIPDFLVKAITAGGDEYIPCDHIVSRLVGESYRYEEADGFVRYWPASGTRIGFFAVKGIKTEDAQPVSGKMQAAVDNKGVTIQDFTLEQEIDKQTDLLVANTGYVTSDPGIPSVNLEFSHALCQIVLCARNIDPAIDVEINGIGLKHIQNVGTLTADFSSAPSTPFTWTLKNVADKDHDTDKPTYKILFKNAEDGKYETVILNGKVGSEPKYLPSSLAPSGKSDSSDSSDKSDAGKDKYVMMAIPQPLFAFSPNDRPHGASLMIHANIWNVADDSGKHSTTDKKVWGIIKDEDTVDGQWMMIPIGGTWEPGKRYVYTITFGGEGTNGGYEEDETDDDKDRVFDPVGFTVTIEPWVKGGDIVKNIY